MPNFINNTNQAEGIESFRVGVGGLEGLSENIIFEQSAG